MLIRISLICVVATISAAAHASYDFNAISCKDSKLRFSEHDICEKKTADVLFGAQMGGSGNYDFYRVSGDVDGYNYNFTFAISQNKYSDYWKYRSSEEKISWIKSYSITTASGTDWSEPISGRAFSMTFNSNGMRCLGFFKNGAPKGMGVASITWGFFCTDPSTASTLDNPDAIIARLKVEE